MLRRNFRAGPRQQRGQVLIAIFLGGLLFGGALGGSAVLFGGLTPKQLTKAINAVEPDETRRKATDDVVKRLKKELKHLNSERSKFDKQALRALERHDTTPDDVAKLRSRADALNRESEEALLNLRFELRAHLSETQWKQVFPAPAPPN
jgi:septal ring factor EnvC (AmiA/AmiB activator)